MASPITTVLFDAVGTLIYLPTSVGAHYREVALRFGLDLPAVQLNEAFSRRWKKAPPRPGTKGPRPDDDRGWWRDLVLDVFTSCLPAERLARFPFDPYFSAVYEHFAAPGVWSAFPDARPTLETLHERGLALAVVSNFDRRLARVLDDLNLSRFFSRIVLSSEVGAEKPDPAIWRHTLAELGTEAARTVHVGDDPERDGSARQVGIEVFELHRPKATLSDFLSWLESRQPV